MCAYVTERERERETVCLCVCVCVCVCGRVHVCGLAPSSHIVCFNIFTLILVTAEVAATGLNYFQ